MSSRPKGNPGGTARSGDTIELIDTPALCIDADCLEANIERMARFGREVPIGIRPHAKAHKTPIVARMQLAAGAVGICCSKLGEAEAMVAGGIDDVLITGEIVGTVKVARLVAIARNARITVAVDNAGAAEQMSAAAASANVNIDVVVDVDVGHGRCGVLPGRPAVELAEVLARLPAIRLRGLQGYQGKIQHLAGYAIRAAAGREASGRLVETREEFIRRGLPVEIVTGAGTGTYESESRRGGMTDIQPGSYIFMDREYVEIGGSDGPVFGDFIPALSVLATVISVPSSDRVVIDAGIKSLSTDAGPAIALDLPGWQYVPYGDEHGVLIRTGSEPQPKLGDVVRLLPGHCDTTVNLYDRFHVTRAGELVDIWPISARGRSQ